jgi:hypothetical protein
VVDELWVHGPPEKSREHIHRYLRPGVTSVNVYLADAPDPSPMALPGLLAQLKEPS